MIKILRLQTNIFFSCPLFYVFKYKKREKQETLQLFPCRTYPKEAG